MSATSRCSETSRENDIALLIAKCRPIHATIDLQYIYIDELAVSILAPIRKFTGIISPLSTIDIFLQEDGPNYRIITSINEAADSSLHFDHFLSFKHYARLLTSGPVIIKPTTGVFDELGERKSPVGNYLRAHQVDTIFFSGIYRDDCYLESVRGGLLEGFNCVVVDDLTTTICEKFIDPEKNRARIKEGLGENANLHLFFAGSEEIASLVKANATQLEAVKPIWTAHLG